jgi:hypothetical protein
MMHDWQRVEGRGQCGDTMRMKVPGGWIYLARECPMRDGVPTAIALTFVPLPTEDVLRREANQEIVEVKVSS